MTDIKDPDQIVITGADASGARDPRDESAGDTLLPMLIASLVLALVGGAILALIYAV